MKIKDLKKELSKFDQKKDIYFSSDDEGNSYICYFGNDIALYPYDYTQKVVGK
jgi:hypothetical protein